MPHRPRRWEKNARGPRFSKKENGPAISIESINIYYKSISMIRRTADVQKENGNGILKTRGRLTPVEAMADGPVAAMAVITLADHERIWKN